MNFLPNLTWQEVDKLRNRTEKVLIPIGSLEQHGPHLPLSTDTIIAFEVAKRVAERLDIALISPINFGFSVEHLGFPGTISLEPLTLIAILEDMCSSLSENGFRKIFIINGHCGNRAIIEGAIQFIKNELNISIYSFTILNMVENVFSKIRESKIGDIGHADEIETSLMLTICPEKVRIDKYVDESPKLQPHLSFETRDRGFSFAWKTKEVSDSGVIGAPSKASKEKGKLILEDLVTRISVLVGDL
ncbi:MAG: creatininase family protein [Candidatus Methylarchaceae archaeon HK02M2]|nr:creatininase family protein [Candidatus Methylarchaceae archaeon HK02M2]